MAAKEEDRILYDLLVPLEWPTEREDLPHEEFPSLWKTVLALVKGWGNLFSRVVKYPFRSAHGIPSLVLSAVNARIPWQLCLNHHGDHLAIIKDDCVELWSIHSDKDSLGTAGKCTIVRDPNPQWRTVCWSLQDTWLAVGNSLACQVFQVRLGSFPTPTAQPKEHLAREATPPVLTNSVFPHTVHSTGELFVVGKNGTFLGRLKREAGEGVGLTGAYAGLMFVPAENFGKRMSGDVLLAVTYDGQLSCYRISEHLKLLHSFSLCQHHPGGVGAVLYHSTLKTLVVAGWGGGEETSNISCWRMLNGAPYYAVASSSTDTKSSPGVLGFLKGHRQRGAGKGGIFCMALSPDGHLLAGVDEAGLLSVWEVPSGRLRNSWTVQQQPRPTESHDTLTATPQGKEKCCDSVPVDVNWWAEDALIIAYSSGDVVVAGLEDLANHLGANPEKCEPGCVVTQATRGGFFILECQCEVRVRPSAFSALIGTGTGGDGAGGVEETDGEESPGKTASQLMKQVLYYMTDLERFRPPQKAAKCIHRTHRLLAIQSTTPEELYERKVRLEEYGEAISLARVYGLDCDVVYQHQWERTPVSVASIRNYLSKVTSTHWVLRECLSCVPDTFDVAKELLLYGLSKTEFSQLAALQEEKEDFLPSLEGEQEGSRDEDNPEEIRRRIQSWGSLSEEQKFLSQCRLRLFEMLDRLCCYERILGGPRYVDDRYRSEEFRWFRDENVVQLAANYARLEDADSVGVLLSLFGSAALPHWLAIVSNFPETTPPGDYRHILPQMSAEGEVLSWKQEVLREADWCEDPQVMELFDLTSEELAQREVGDFLYRDQPEWETYRAPITADLLTLWYSERTVEIEQLSGQVDSALALVELGMEHLVPGLEVLHHDFQTLYTLVYHCDVDPTLSLTRLRHMSTLEKVQAMMRKVDVQHFRKCFVDHVHPFLCRVEAIVPGASGQVLEDFLIQVAAEDLEPCLVVLELLTDRSSAIKVISEDSEVVCLALHCIYASSRSDQLAVIEKMIDCLPKRSNTDSQGLSLFHDEVDQVRVLLEAAWILTVNDVKKSLIVLKNLLDDAKGVEQLFVQYTRSAGRRQTHLSAVQWKEALNDMLEMRQTVFHCVAERSCYEIFALSVMCSGDFEGIELGSQLLTCPFPFPIQPQSTQRGSRSSSSLTGGVFSYRLPEAESAQLVLTAAKEYTNAAARVSDSEVGLAKKCLQLLGNSTKEAVSEMNLIRAFEMLDGLGLEVIPLKIRMCENKLDIIKDLLKASPHVYKQHRKVLEVASLLGLDTTEYDEDTTLSRGMGETLILLIRAGLEQNDGTVALKLCQEVIYTRLGAGWSVCRDVALNGGVQDPTVRQSLLEFSALHCPLEVLEEVLHAHSLVEVEALCANVTGDTRSGVVQGLLERGADTVEQLWTQGSGSVQRMMSYRPSLTQAVSLVKTAAKALPPLGYSSLRGYSLLRGYPSSEEPPDIADSAAVPEEEHVTPLSEEGDSCEEGDRHDGTFDLEPRNHVFYDTAGNVGQVKKSYLTGHYLGLEKGMTVGQCSLRAQWVTGEGESEEDSRECDTLMLLKAAEETLHHDCPLALSFLLAVQDPLSTEHLLDRLRSSRFSLQFILYFLALELNAQIPLQPGGEKEAILLEKGTALIASCTEHVTSHAFSDQSDEVQKLMNLFKKYHRSLVELEQAETLMGLDMGIDVLRFAQEEDYRQEIILSLARSTSEKVFATSLSLAASYDMGEWQVYMTHLQWLLTDSRLSAVKVKKHIAQVQLVEKLVVKPEESAESLRSKVYPLMDGKNFDLLRVFFTVLKSCSKEDGEEEEEEEGRGSIAELKPEIHLKLLQGLKVPLKGLNYKSLMSGEDPLSILSPFLTDSNIHTVANLASNIPNNAGGWLTPSDVYRHFAEELFWEGEVQREGGEEEGGCLMRYDSCLEYLSRLTASDLLEFVKGVTVKKRALPLPRVSRVGILQCGMELAHKQATTQEADSGGEMEREHSQLSFASVASELRMCLKHLQVIIQHIGVLEESLPEWCVEQFEVSLSQPVPLEQLSMEMVARGCDLAAMETVLKCGLEVQPHSLRTSEIVIRTLTGTLDSLSTESLSVVESICVTCTADDGRHVSLGEVVEALVHFAEDRRKAAHLRLAVLAIIRKVLPPTSMDPTLLLLHQTRVLVEGHFDTEVKMETLGSPESRSTLFSFLLSVAVSADQLATLAQLLKLWPSSRDTQSHWCSLLEAAVGHEQARHMVPVLRAGLDTIPAKVDGRLYSRLLDEGQNLLATKFAFITTSTDLHRKALDCIANMDEQEVIASAEDGSLIELLVLRKAVPSIVSSPLFVHLHQTISQCPKVDLELFAVLLGCKEEEVVAKLSLDDVKSHAQIVAKQLYEAGYWLEAGSLLVSATPHYHPALQTLNTAYSFMTKLFQK